MSAGGWRHGTTFKVWLQWRHFMFEVGCGRFWVQIWNLSITGAWRETIWRDGRSTPGRTSYIRIGWVCRNVSISDETL